MAHSEMIERAQAVGFLRFLANNVLADGFPTMRQELGREATENEIKLVVASLRSAALMIERDSIQGDHRHVTNLTA